MEETVPALPQGLFRPCSWRRGIENITAVDQAGSLDYHGWFIMGVYNPGNGEGFGRIVAVDHMDIIKLLFNRGFELFPHYQRSHEPFSGYLFAVTKGAKEILSIGMKLAGETPRKYALD